MSRGSLQDLFLNALRKSRTSVSIFLVNGIKLQGQVESFDQYVVMLKGTVTQLVYKHSISTVVPTRHVRYHEFPDQQDNGNFGRPPFLENRENDDQDEEGNFDFLASDDEEPENED